MVYGRGLAWVVVGSAVGAPLAVGKNTHPPLLLLVWLHYKTSSSGCVSTAAALGLAWVVVGSAVGAPLAIGKNTHPPLLLLVWLHYKTSTVKYITRGSIVTSATTSSGTEGRHACIPRKCRENSAPKAVHVNLTFFVFRCSDNGGALFGYLLGCPRTVLALRVPWREAGIFRRYSTCFRRSSTCFRDAGFIFCAGELLQGQDVGDGRRHCRN
jgi:hypothetical protein